jgi:protein-L-isoaspartate(D-aspartate) O-methyltransferase
LVLPILKKTEYDLSALVMLELGTLAPVALGKAILMKFKSQALASLICFSLPLAHVTAQQPAPQPKPPASNGNAPTTANGKPATPNAKPTPTTPKTAPKLDMSSEAVAGRILTKLSPQVRGELNDYKAERDNLIDHVLIPGGVKDPRAIEAIRATPRHTFVPDALKDESYRDKALPIGEAQTISSPYTVATMTESLNPMPTDKVLEIGTGSGYQAAVLSPLVKDVYTIEIVEPIGRETTEFLKSLGYENVHTKIGDGFKGWAEHAPFQKIIVTCSPESVPQPLIDQLDNNGLMIIPVGTRHQQQLHVFKKEKDKLVSLSVRPTLFVPMTGEAESLRTSQEPQGVSLVNGDFEERPIKPGIIPGWYYEFNAKLVRDAKAPSGKNCIEFASQNGELPSMLIQGFKLDGRETLAIKMRGAASPQDIQPGPGPNQQPIIALQLLDENREPIGNYWLGPFTGTHKWKVEQQTFSVPNNCREALIQIGLFGATGTIRFDGISVEIPKR